MTVSAATLDIVSPACAIAMLRSLAVCALCCSMARSIALRPHRSVRLPPRGDFAPGPLHEIHACEWLTAAECDDLIELADEVGRGADERVCFVGVLACPSHSYTPCVFISRRAALSPLVGVTMRANRAPNSAPRVRALFRAPHSSLQCAPSSLHARARRCCSSSRTLATPPPARTPPAPLTTVPAPGHRPRSLSTPRAARRAPRLVE